MRFVEPLLLYLLLGLPLLAGLSVAVSLRRRAALRRFAGGEAGEPRFVHEVSAQRRAAKRILLLVGAGAAIVAAARPQWGTRLEPITRKGVDVVIALDTSLSMAAADAPPDRLGQARHAAASLIRKMGGNRVAILAFAGKAVLACPLTLDQEAALLFLDPLDVDAVAVPGTALGEALEKAIRAFGPTLPSETRSRALVVFSDGEDHERGIDEAVRDLKKAGVTVFAVGCGTRRGAPIPLRSSSGATSGYKKDRQDRIVTTRLNDEVLGKVALDTGGRYFDATPSEIEVDEIVRSLAEMDAREFGTVLRARYEERFQFPLAVALAALVAETLLSDRKRTRRSWRPARKERAA